jgi:hypothetical protein
MSLRQLRARVGIVASVLLVLSATPALAAPESRPVSQNAPPQFQVPYPPPSKPLLDQIPPTGVGINFQFVGHNPLLDNDLIPGLTPMGIPRGGNGNLGAAAGPCVYVGSLTGSIPALIVDVSDPTNPTVLGPVPGHVPGIGHGIDQIDTIADLNLMVIHMRPAVVGGFNRENATSLQIYDISDCRAPRLVTNFPLGQEAGVNSGLHMSTIWRDPKIPTRVLHVNTFLATFTDPGAPTPDVPGQGRNIRPDDVDIRVVDLTGCPTSCNPSVVGAWGMEAESGIPKLVKLTFPDGSQVTRSAVTHQAAFSVDGTRLRVTQLGMGMFQLDSSLLADNQPCEPTSPRVGESTAARASHCLKLLNPNIVERVEADGTKLPGRANWDPPFYAANVHTAANVPGKPYVVVADEPSTAAYTACPWGWMRILYVGDRETGPDKVPYHGDLSPGIVGTMASAENIPDRCPKEGITPGPETYGSEITRNDHGPHEPLVFPDLVIATYYSNGLKAYAIDNPLMPMEVGAFYNKPVDDIRFCWVNCSPPERDAEGRTVRQPPDPSFGPVDMRAFSRPLSKDGLIYYVDANSGLYVVRYTGPHADEVPGNGICVTGNIQQAGYEPCPPYGP